MPDEPTRDARPADDTTAADEPTATESTEPDGDAPTAKATGSPRRRPNPAASAASRARRIGGAPAARTTVAEPAADAAPASDPVDGKKGRKAKAAEAVSTEKPGKTAAAGGKERASARDLKNAAVADQDATVITQVPNWVRWVPASVLTLCAVAMIVLVAVTSHSVWYAKPSAASVRDHVLAAAKRCTALTNTYKYTTIAADQKRGLACTTGDWSTQYASAMQKIVKPTATKLKASQSVQINAAGIESIAGHGAQWTVVLYGQTTINQHGESPRIDPFSAVVRMDHIHGTYLVSKIDLITSPNS